MQFATKIGAVLGRKQHPVFGFLSSLLRRAPMPLFFIVAPLVLDPLGLAPALLNHLLD
jgi:hypothetical protein